MVVSECEGAELGDVDEATEVEDLAVGVSAVEDSREVKHLGAVVHFGPEAVLESLLLSLEGGCFFNEVEVGEDGDDFRQAVRVQRRQRFESFHLKTKRAVHEQEHEVGHFGHIHHGAHVVGRLNEGQSPAFARDNSDGTFDVRHCGFGEAAHKTPDQSRLADLGGSKGHKKLERTVSERSDQEQRASLHQGDP